MNYSKLKELQAQKNLSNREIAKELEISDSGYNKMIENQTLTVKMLEKLAVFYGVDVSIFFKEKSSHSYPENSKVDYAEDRGEIFCPFCILKDEQIKNLEMHRDDLRKQVSLLEFSLGKSQQKA